MKKLREHIIFRVFWGMLALHIFNIGIDAPDMFFQQKENLGYNDIESIAELVLENILQIDNAIHEHDDADDDYKFKFEKKIDFYLEIIVSIKISNPVPPSFQMRPFYDGQYSNSCFGRSCFQPPEGLV